MRRLVPTVLVLAFVACGDGGTSPAAISGSYILQTVNGKSLPAVVAEDAVQRQEVTSGTLDVKANRTWHLTLDEQVTRLSDNSVVVQSLVATGSYTLSGSAITFSAPGLGSIGGTVAGSTLNVGGSLLGTPVTLVFTK